MSEQINAVIIDDEVNFITSLRVLINQYFPKINIVGKASNVKDAINLLNLTEIHLAFMDIGLPDGNAFDILQNVENRNFEIIFTTAVSEYALQAFEFAALHYLIKPITLEKLQSAMDRYLATKDTEHFDEKIEFFKNNIENSEPKKILLSYSNGLAVYNISDIVRCESEDNYSNVYLENGKKIIATKSLLIFTKILHKYGFVRIHNQHLINLKYLSKYSSGKNPVVIMQDCTKLPVSRTYKNEFANELKKFAQII